VTSDAAYSACSCVAATTTASGCPFQKISSPCITGSVLAAAPPPASGVPNAGGAFIGGAFSCVTIASTPGAALAAPRSMCAIVPLAMVL